MLTGSTSTSKLRTSKGTLVLVGFVFIFLITSVAVGLRTSNAALPLAGGCHGGEGEDTTVTCTTSSSSTTTQSSSSTSSTTSSSTTTTVTTAIGTVSTTTTTSQQDPPAINHPQCNALDGISYQGLAAGTTLTIPFNGNGQMTFTVPSEKSFNWNWYWIPANGQSTTTLGQKITTAMWADGHGQDFSFFVAKLNGQTGLVLQTDYLMSQACN